jgi:tetratricopeptide (TPR) repeat protein
MSGYAVAHVNDIPEVNDGRIPMRPVRHHLGIASFGINAWTGRNAGDRIINEHDEADRVPEDPESPEELYLVLQGRAVFELDGERQDAPTGTFVFVRPGVKRTAFAEEPDTTIVSVGATPGRAYEPVGWELWSPIRPLYEAGKHAEVVECLREVVAANPQYGLLFYNLACCESLTGQTADALVHLRRSLELSEQLREFARTDSDLDPIRDEPAFKEMVGN